MNQQNKPETEEHFQKYNLLLVSSSSLTHTTHIQMSHGTKIPFTSILNLTIAIYS